MTDPIRSENRTTKRVFQDTCRECGTDPVTEESAILSAVLGDPALALPSYVTNEAERGSDEYWDWLTDQLLAAQDEHVHEVNIGYESTA